MEVIKMNENIQTSITIGQAVNLVHKEYLQLHNKSPTVLFPITQDNREQAMERVKFMFNFIVEAKARATNQ